MTRRSYQKPYLGKQSVSDIEIMLLYLCIFFQVKHFYVTQLKIYIFVCVWIAFADIKTFSLIELCQTKDLASVCKISHASINNINPCLLFLIFYNIHVFCFIVLFDIFVVVKHYQSCYCSYCFPISFKDLIDIKLCKIRN